MPFIQSSIAAGLALGADLLRRERLLQTSGGRIFPSPDSILSPCALNRIGQWTLVLSTRDDAQGGSTGLDGADESVSPVPFNVSEVPVQWNMESNRIHVAAARVVCSLEPKCFVPEIGPARTRPMASMMASHPLLACALFPFSFPRIGLWVPACVPNLPALACVPQTVTQLPALSSHDPCRPALDSWSMLADRHEARSRGVFGFPGIQSFLSSKLAWW